MVWTGGAVEDPGVAELREITEVCDAMPPLPPAWCELVAFAASYYQRGIGEIALSVLPTELRRLGNAAIANRLARLDKRLSKEDAAEPIAQEPAPALSPAQIEARDRIAAAMAGVDPGTVLLHGTTGSGKTEVYLRAAAAALAKGRQALVLVPEINLTPQLVARFAGRFAGKRIVALHSGLTPAERLRHWLMAHTGRADIVLGTRLAVFASLPRLGLIVVDEEHDPSYKQQEGARYSARDLAVWRGRNESVLVVLGSATPSLESWHRADAGRYLRIGLPERIGGAAWPEVRLVDMNRLPRTGASPSPLAPPLVAAIEARIARGEQSLVFLNRRGYAPVLHCMECGWKSACPHCSAWRVFHKQDRTLRCHHCGLAEAVPRACPDCGNPDIAPIGRGTERLEEQMAALLPGARIARIDSCHWRGAELVPQPRALPLRVLPGRDDDGLPDRRRRSLAEHQLAHCAVPAGIPRRRIGGHVRKQRAHFVRPPAGQHRIDPCFDPPRQVVAGIDHKIVRDTGHRARRRRVRIAQARTGQERGFDRPQQLRPSQMRAWRIECRTPAAQFRERKSSQLGVERRARRAVERRCRAQRCHQRVHIKTRPAHNDRRTRRSRLFIKPLRGARRPPAGRPPLHRVCNVDANVRDATAIGTGRLRRADIEAAVELTRVGAHDRRAGAFGQLHRDAGLPRRRRTADDAQRRWSANAGQTAARAHPSPGARWSRARARRARAAWCARALRRARASRPARADRRP